MWLRLVRRRGGVDGSTGVGDGFGVTMSYGVVRARRGFVRYFFLGLMGLFILGWRGGDVGWWWW